MISTPSRGSLDSAAHSIDLSASTYAQEPLHLVRRYPCLNQSTNLGGVAAYLARADHTDACDVIEFDHRLGLEVRGEEQRE